MELPPNKMHPTGEQVLAQKTAVCQAVEVETYAGKLHIEWNPEAAVTPMGQLPFFIEFL